MRDIPDALWEVWIGFLIALIGFCEWAERRIERRRVWAEYVPGQEIRKDPTPEYLDAMQEAIDAVAAKEQPR